MDAIYWVNCRYKLIIYRHLDDNKKIRDKGQHFQQSIKLEWAIRIIEYNLNI